jgi:hypothetical protein
LDGGLAGKVPSADTDELGRFQISRLWLGKFQVAAKKEDEGYPDTNSGFYSDRKVAPITLSLSHLSPLKVLWVVNGGPPCLGSPETGKLPWGQIQLGDYVVYRDLGMEGCRIAYT